MSAVLRQRELNLFCALLNLSASADNPAWPLDVPISDLASAGPSCASVVRMKLFTLDHRFVLRKAGRLVAVDAKKVQQILKSYLGEIQTVRSGADVSLFCLGRRQPSGSSAAAPYKWACRRILWCTILRRLK